MPREKSMNNPMIEEERIHAIQISHPLIVISNLVLVEASRIVYLKSESISERIVDCIYI